jgi:hypothetical protein
MKTRWSWLWCLLVVPAWASSEELPARIAQERERLQLERAAIEQSHADRMRECWQRFVVNACLQEVRRSRHAALAPIRAQELELNAQDRAWRSQQRDERLQDKQRARERQP